MKRKYIYFRTGIGCLTAALVLLFGLAAAAAIMLATVGEERGAVLSEVVLAALLAVSIVVDETTARRHKAGHTKPPSGENAVHRADDGTVLRTWRRVAARAAPAGAWFLLAAAFLQWHAVAFQWSAAFCQWYEFAGYGGGGHITVNKETTVVCLVMSLVLVGVCALLRRVIPRRHVSSHAAALAASGMLLVGAALYGVLVASPLSKITETAAEDRVADLDAVAGAEGDVAPLLRAVAVRPPPPASAARPRMP